MMRMAFGVLSVFTMVGSATVARAQNNTDPCMNHDYSAMAMLLSDVGAAANDAAALDASRRLGPCLTFVVTLTTTINTWTPLGAQMYITGTATFPITLGAGSLQDAGYDYATPPEGVTATMTYTNPGAEGGPCTATVAPSKPTKWNFWFGLTLSPDAKAALVASPDEQDVNDVLIRCDNKPPQRQKASILAPGWVAAHGEGDDGTAGPAGSAAAQQMLGGINAGNLGDLQAKAKQLEQMQKSGASPQEIEKMMKSMMPGLGAADAALDKAEDNFMIKIPIELVTGRADLVKYSFTKSQALKGGQGTVTERTTIEVVHLPSSKK